MDSTLVEEITKFVYQHTLDATITQYADQLAAGDGEPVAIWLRVSSGKQDEANQLPEVLRNCASRSYRPVKFYVCHDKSASKGEHQQKLDEMIEDVRQGLIKKVVCWKSSRLERRGGMALMAIVTAVADAGGTVQAVESDLGEDSVEKRVMTFFRGEMDHEYVKDLARNTKLSMDRIESNGALRGYAPWGYEVVGEKYNKTIRPTELGKKYIPEIFQRCIKGDSIRTICAWLDSEGVLPTRGERWNEGSLHQIIRNMTYAGRRQNEGPTKPGAKYPSRKDKVTVMHCEAVITMDIWQDANDALRNRPRRGPGGGGSLPNRPLLASLKCARCADSPMNRMVGGDKDHRRQYYRCYGRAPQRKGCGNMIQLERLETFVLVEIIRRHNESHETKVWVDGINFDAQILDITQELSELPRKMNAASPEYITRVMELSASLADYQGRETTKGHYEKEPVYKADGSIMTKGEYFFNLDNDGRREFLREHDIRAEKMSDGSIRLTIDGEEVIANPYMVALLDAAGPRVAKIMLERRIPDFADWQALLSGLAVPGSSPAELEVIVSERASRDNP